MVIVLGSVDVPADRLEEALRISHEHVERSLREEGCLEHGVYQAPHAPGRLMFVERWADPAALQRHFRVPASQAFARALGALASGRPQMTVYDAAPVTMG